MTTTRRDLSWTCLDAVVADAKSLHEDGYSQVGKWDLTQTCLHLSKTMRSSVQGFDGRLPWILRLVVQLIGVKRRAYRTRRLRTGLPAPKDFIYPSDGGDPQKQQQAIARLIEAIEIFQQGRGRYTSHPAFGRISDDEWYQFHVIHAMHHLSFLRPNQTLTAHQHTESAI